MFQGGVLPSVSRSYGLFILDIRAFLDIRAVTEFLNYKKIPTKLLLLFWRCVRAELPDRYCNAAVAPIAINSTLKLPASVTHQQADVCD